MVSLTSVIIEDEPLARELIKNYLSEHLFIENKAECSDGFQGIKAIQEYKPDLIFLDIQMPKINGFEMLELLEQPPIVIFTTAFNEYAIKAFEMNAADYLLKPFSRDRFKRAIDKAVELLQHKQVQPLAQIQLDQQTLAGEKLERVVVKNGTKIHVIAVSDILYLEAQDDYVMLYTTEGKHLKQQTMKYFESSFDSGKFIRIHRSYMVNIQHIAQLQHYEKEQYKLILHNKVALPVSKSGYGTLKKVLGL